MCIIFDKRLFVCIFDATIAVNFGVKLKSRINLKRMGYDTNFMR